MISNGHWAGSVNIGSHPAGYHIAAVGDFAHDGTGDILWYNPSNGDVDLWKIIDGHWAAATPSDCIRAAGRLRALATSIKTASLTCCGAAPPETVWRHGCWVMAKRNLLVEGSKLGVKNAELFL
jgi:hypothetical protein